MSVSPNNLPSSAELIICYLNVFGLYRIYMIVALANSLGLPQGFRW